MNKNMPRLGFEPGRPTNLNHYASVTVITSRLWNFMNV